MDSDTTRDQQLSSRLERSLEPVLVIDQATLRAAGLYGRVRLIIGSKEIRIVPEPESEPEAVLEQLAGSLGNEPAEDYDFGLKVGGLYEAR